MSEQSQFNTLLEFSADDWPGFDLGDYDEALRNGYSDDAAYVYAVEVAASRRSHTALPGHGYNNSVSSGQPMEFEYSNIYSDHAQNSSVHNQVQQTPNDGAAYPEFLVNLSTTSHVYPEPPSPSAAFGLDSAWILPDEDFSAGNPSTREAGASTLVTTQTPPTPNLVYTSSSTPSSERHYSTPPQDTRSIARNVEVPGHNRWADTYAGRRGAKAREDFPRECGACHKRFLYEDSAVKHYRLHHSGPVDIILRYDAPKRPVPGRPRNTRAAKSQVRRGVTPSTSGSEVRSQSPQTAPGSSSLNFHHPVLTHFADDNLTQLSAAGSGAGAASGDARVSTHLPAPVYGGNYGVPPDNAFVGAATTINQPHADSFSMSNVDPALLAKSSGEGLLHSQQHIPPIIAPISQLYDAPPHLGQPHPLTANRHVATLDKQLPLPPLTTNNILPDTAQEALRGVRQLNAATAPYHAQAAIQNCFRSPQVHLQDPVSTNNLFPQPIQSGTDAVTTATTGTTPTTNGRTSPSTLRSTPQLQTDTATDTIQPQVPPSGLYDEQKARIFLHPYRERWYKCFNGIWKHWDNEMSAWVNGP